MSQPVPVPVTITQDQKIDLILFLLVQQQQSITQIQESLVTEQADFNADITALTNDLTPVLTFLAALPAQLTAIQTALANQGITDVSPLDALVSQASSIDGNVSSLQTTLGTLPGGTPAT
jgi:long-subunit fatty acid transport protein